MTAGADDSMLGSSDDSRASARPLSSTEWVLGVSLLVAALTFYYFAVLRIDYRQTGLLDLDPQPDAVEYFAQANAIAAGTLPHIKIANDTLPSRYPPGYPTLMALWVKVLGSSDSILAPFRTNQTVGGLMIIGAFAAYASLRQPLAGGLAALLLTTLPALFTYSRSSLSEISASAFVAAGFFVTYLGLSQNRRLKIYGAAVLLGLAINIRMQSLFFAPLLLAMALMPMRASRLRWLAHCVGALAAYGLAAAPFCVLNTIQFHSPFKTGYDFWVPWFSERGLPFAAANIHAQIRMLWAEFSLTRQSYSVANIFGTGTHFVPAFALLACAGFFFLPRTRFTFCALLSGLTFIAATISYSFVDCRFYLPLLVLLVPLAVLPLIWATKRLAAGSGLAPAFCVYVLYAAACVGYPSQSGYLPQQGHSQAWDAVRNPIARNSSRRFAAQQYLASVVDDPRALVLADVDPVYLNTLLPVRLTAAPIDGKHGYRHSKLWHYDEHTAAALVEKAVAVQSNIYALFPSTSEMSSSLARLPRPTGADWVLFKESTSGVVLRLAETPPQ